MSNEDKLLKNKAKLKRKLKKHKEDLRAIAQILATKFKLMENEEYSIREIDFIKTITKTALKNFNAKHNKYTVCKEEDIKITHYTSDVETSFEIDTNNELLRYSTKLLVELTEEEAQKLE